MTSPFSIYILIGLTYPDYKAEPFAAYIDSGSGICLSKPACFPEEYHTDLPAIQGKDISNQNIVLTKGIKHPRILISKYIVKLPLLYFHNTGCDILLGNNFLQLFKIIIQHNISYSLRLKTPCNHWITTPRLKQAYSRKFPIPFIPRSQRGDYPIPLPLPKNDFSTPLLRLEARLLKSLDFCEQIKTRLETLYVDNPLQFWDSNKIYANLELKDPDKIIRVKPMRHNELDVKEFQVQLKELCDLNLIRPSKSPHSSPAFMVRNRNEINRNKARMVVNYKQLNDNTIFDGYFLPNKETLIHKTRNCNWHSKFDCKSGFYQIKMTEESKPLTAFSTPQGHYEWNVLPFGLKNAPQIFQRKMDNIFKDYDFIHVYMDDMLISSKTKEQHLKHLDTFIDLCKTHGIGLSKKKSIIGEQKIEFLGLMIDFEGIELQNHILEKIKDFPERLTDRKQLQRFLGILNYAEGFIKNLADLRKPLRKLTSEKIKFVFNKEHEDQIRFIKTQCINLPKLKLPLDNDDLILETDSSESTWAAVLKRIQGNTEEICRYTSGTFTPTEERYHINEKEFLAVIKGFKKFSYFLLPKRFLLRTDNTQVKAFIKNNLPSKPEYKRLIRWQTYCSEYIFDIDIIRSHKNVTADFLTRDGGNSKD